MTSPAKTSPSAELTALKHALTTYENGGLARFAQLRDALLAGIKAGHWKAGDRLPTESALVAALPFSLGTVQRALRALVEAGIITRIQGSGSFVAATHHRIDDVVHCRFLDDDGVSILPVFSTVLSRKPWSRAASWRANFERRDAKLIRLERILDVNGEFKVFSRFYFDGERFPSLAGLPLANLAGANFKALLRQELHVPITGSRQTLQLIPLPRVIARHIGVDDGCIGGLAEIVGQSGINDTVYFQQIFLPPTARKLLTSTAA